MLCSLNLVGEDGTIFLVGGVLMSAVFHILCTSVEMHIDRQLKTSFKKIMRNTALVPETEISGTKGIIFCSCPCRCTVN